MKRTNVMTIVIALLLITIITVASGCRFIIGVEMDIAQPRLDRVISDMDSSKVDYPAFRTSYMRNMQTINKRLNTYEKVLQKLIQPATAKQDTTKAE